MCVCAPVGDSPLKNIRFSLSLLSYHREQRQLQKCVGVCVYLDVDHHIRNVENSWLAC